MGGSATWDEEEDEEEEEEEDAGRPDERRERLRSKIRPPSTAAMTCCQMAQTINT
jgi:hypothetical protein